MGSREDPIVMPSTKLVASDALPVFWSLRGVVGTGLNEIMPEEEARRLQRFYEYKGAYLVSSIDGVSWTPETNVPKCPSCGDRACPGPHA
jgi:hypothetical protein